MKHATHESLSKVRTGCRALAMMALATGAAMVAPEVRAQDASAMEGDAVEFALIIPGNNTSPSDIQQWAISVRYSYRTQDSTAKAGEDYESKTGKVVFSATQYLPKIKVSTHTDSVEEDDETFRLELYDRQVKGLYPGHTQWSSGPPSFPVPSEFTVTGEIRNVAASTSP